VKIYVLTLKAAPYNFQLKFLTFRGHNYQIAISMQNNRVKLLRRFIWVFLIFFVISNFTILNEFLPGTWPHRFCSDKGQYQAYELPTKRYALLSVQKNFSEYRYSTNKDIILYRRFYRRWWQIWNWVDFMTNERWTYPYANSDEAT
jgi:hypothetical protein